MTAGELANKLNGELKGDAHVVVTGVASLDEAGEHHVSFLANSAYSGRVADTNAGAVILPADWDGIPGDRQAWILVQNPSEAFSAAVELFAPPPVSYPPGVHPQAWVAPDATVPDCAHVGPFAVLEPGVVLGERTVVAAGCYVGRDTSVGADCLLYPNVTLREATRIGDRVIIHSGAVLGSDGYGFIPGREGHTKIPQRGIVQVDDDVEIGAQVAIDRARFGRTWIKRGVKIDNLVHIAHNVVVGEHTFLLGQSGISGSTTLGARVILAGQSGLAGHLSIGDDAVIMGQAGVSRDLPAGAKVVGMPAVDRREYAKRIAAGRQVERLKEELRALQERVARLESRGPEDA